MKRVKNEREILISVMTPCYNAGSLITELEQSLLEQGTNALEWVIVDDGSASNTLRYLEEIERRASLPIKLIRTTNLGPSHARNLGFNSSRGRWVKFVDADDLLDPMHLSKQFEIAQTVPTAIIFSPTHSLYDSGSGKRIERFEGMNIEDRSDPFRDCLFQSAFCHSSALYPRFLLDSVGGYDETLSSDEDGDFVLRLFLEKPKLIGASNSRFIYRNHNYNSRITSSNDSKVWDSLFRVCKKMEPLLSSRGLLDNYRNKLAMRYDSIAVRALLTSDNRAVIALALKRAKSRSANYPRLAPFYVFYLRTFLAFRLAEILRCFISHNQLWKFFCYGIR